MARLSTPYFGPGRTNPVRIEAYLRAVKALELRKQGLPYRQIAWDLKYSNANKAREAVLRILDNGAKEPAEEVRALEIERLDSLLAAHWQRAMISVESARFVLTVMERRARLLGLDAPSKIDITAWIREMAIKDGLDPEDAVRTANDIVVLASAER